MLNQCSKRLVIFFWVFLLVACGGAPKKPEIVIEKKVVDAPPVLTEIDKKRFQDALQFMSQGELNKAEPLFSQLIVDQPKLTGAYVNLGVIKKAKKQSDEAIAFFNKALDVNPNFIDALLQQALMMQDAGKFIKAEEFLRRAEAVDPKHPLVQYNLGVLYELYLQDYTLAIKHYERYVEISNADDVETVKRWIILLERK